MYQKLKLNKKSHSAKSSSFKQEKRNEKSLTIKMKINTKNDEFKY